MFSAKCANPDCEAIFDYRYGRLFRFHDSELKERALSGTHAVRHFWLCDSCSHKYTLQYEEGAATLLRQEGRQFSASKKLLVTTQV